MDNKDNNRILSFEEIIAAQDREIKDVHVPEWGGSVRMQVLSGADRDGYIQTLQKRMVGTGDNRRISNYEGLPATLLQKALIKEDGSPLFTLKKISEFSKKNGAVIDRLVGIAQEMNGLTEDEVNKQAGNSETTQSEGGGTE